MNIWIIIISKNIQKLILYIGVAFFIIGLFINHTDPYPLFDSDFFSGIIGFFTAMIGGSIANAIIFLLNIYKQKNYNSIKNNGEYSTGFIIRAMSEHKYKVPFLLGKLYVDVNGITYIIDDIYYNEDFKAIEKELSEIRTSYYLRKSHQIKIDIYVLNNKVVADLDSISI